MYVEIKGKGEHINPFSVETIKKRPHKAQGCIIVLSSGREITLLNQSAKEVQDVMNSNMAEIVSASPQETQESAMATSIEKQMGDMELMLNSFNNRIRKAIKEYTPLEVERLKEAKSANEHMLEIRRELKTTAEEMLKGLIAETKASTQ